VSGGYFRVMRIPVVSGRGFADEDTARGVSHAIVSAAAAARLFGDRSAIGKRIVLDMRPNRPIEIVGVVGDVRFKSVESASSAAIYFLSGENAGAPRLNTRLFVRSSVTSDVATAAVRKAIQEAATPMSIADARSLTELVRAATSSTRFIAALLVGFATTAVLLAALGIYGVISYIVSQRTREFGVRIMLGADSRDLLLSTVRRAVWLVGGGVGAGLIAAGAGARLLGSFLYGIGTFDLATYLTVVALVTVLGLVATFLPARRITRIDPAEVLRA